MMEKHGRDISSALFSFAHSISIYSILFYSILLCVKMVIQVMKTLKFCANTLRNVRIITNEVLGILLEVQGDNSLQSIINFSFNANIYPNIYRQL